MRATHPAHRDDMTAHTGCAMAAQPASPLALRLTGLRAWPSVLAAPPAVATVLPGRGLWCCLESQPTGPKELATRTSRLTTWLDTARAQRCGWPARSGRALAT